MEEAKSKIIFLIFGIFCLLTTLKATAQSCETRDLNPQLGEIRNQSNVGWCFANTGADLLTFAHSQQLNKYSESQVSAIFTALNFYRSQIDGGTNHDEVFNQGGFTLDAINIVQSKGFICPQSLDLLLMKTGYNTPLKEKFIKFKLFYDVYQEYKKTGSSDKKTVFLNMINSLNEKGTFLSAYDPGKIKFVLEAPTLEEATMRMVDVVCENKKIPMKNKNLFARMTKLASGDFFYSQDNSTVKANNMIFILDYILDQNRPLGVTYMVEKILTPPEVSSGAHASVISGRKLINGECHYQIRNSWGPDCTRLALVDNVLQKNYPIYKYTCENGTVWIPRKELQALTEEIVFQVDGNL